MTINEKVSYLKGLMEGLSLDDSKPEAKILKMLSDIVGDIALTLEDMQEEIDTAKDYCEELDEDLGNVESFLLGDDDDDDDDDFCDCDDCDVDDCDGCDGCFDDDDDDDDLDPMFAVQCPDCGDEVYFDDTIDVKNLKCPNCGAKIEIEEIDD